MDNYVQIFCETCGDSYLTEKVNTIGRYKDDYLECWECKTSTKVIPNDEISNPELFFEAADKELENDNYHDRIGIAGDIWETVKEYIPEEKKIETAKNICKKILSY